MVVSIASAVQYADITNHFINNVSLIGTNTNTVKATINKLNNSFGVAVPPDGTKADMINYIGNTVSVIPNDTAHYTTTATKAVSINVTQATPTITWSNPANITYGTALSNTQLDAKASVPGTLVYTPQAGTILDPGSQTLSTTFTPNDSANYTTASKSVSINVTT